MLATLAGDALGMCAIGGVSESDQSDKQVTKPHAESNTSTICSCLGPAEDVTPQTEFDVSLSSSSSRSSLGSTVEGPGPCAESDVPGASAGVGASAGEKSQNVDVESQKVECFGLEKQRWRCVPVVPFALLFCLVALLLLP